MNMTTAKISNSTTAPPGPLTVAAGRLASIAYNCVGIQTEAGPAPYTRIVNAGGSSGLSVGVFQNDFKQHPETAGPYAQAVFDWNADKGEVPRFSQKEFTQALKAGDLTADMKTLVKNFGGSTDGATWIHNAIDVPHLNAAVQAAEQAFATSYGQAVLAEGAHVEEFAAFAMKVYNQYGPGVSGAAGAVASPGFGALLDYLNDGAVYLRDNRNGGYTVPVVAGYPNGFSRADLDNFSRAYADTRAKPHPQDAVHNGPMDAMNSGALYKTVLDSDSPLTNALLRTEAKGGFSPSQTMSNPDIAISRAIFGADTESMRKAVVAMGDDHTVAALQLPVNLGQFPGSLWIDPVSGQAALTYRGKGNGYVIGEDGYATFDASSVVRVNGIRTLQIAQGGTAIPFAEADTPTSYTGTPGAQPLSMTGSPIDSQAPTTPLTRFDTEDVRGHLDQKTGASFIEYKRDVGGFQAGDKAWEWDGQRLTVRKSGEVETERLDTGSGDWIPTGHYAAADKTWDIAQESGGSVRYEFFDNGGWRLTRTDGGGKLQSRTETFDGGGWVTENAAGNIVDGYVEGRPLAPDPAGGGATVANPQDIPATVQKISYTLPDGASGEAFTVKGRSVLVQNDTDGKAYLVNADGSVSELKPENYGIVPVAYRPDPLYDALLDAFAQTRQPITSKGILLASAADTINAGTMTDAGPGDGEGGQAAAEFATDPAPTTSIPLTPYAQSLSSVLTLIQAIEQGNPLSVALSGIGAANALNRLTNGANAGDIVPGSIGSSLSALSGALNLADAMDRGDTLGALGASANLASQAAGLMGGHYTNVAFDALDGGAFNLAAESAALESAAASQALGQFAGVLGIAGRLRHDDPLGAISAALMMNPATAPVAIAFTIARAFFGGLFGGGEFVRAEDGGIQIDASGTDQHKSTEGAGSGLGTQGGQAVAGALRALLGELQGRVDAHNTASPDAPLALVPERLPQLHWRDPAFYIQWNDAQSGESKSLAASAATLADNLRAVAGAGQAVVPQWVADTIALRLAQGEAEAWKPAASQAEGENQTRNLLVIGNGPMNETARSDLDGDGWFEAHTWNSSNLVLSIDGRGDGVLQGLADLLTLAGDARAANRLGWLDANGDEVLDARDPGFAAIRLWLDVNGDARSEANETATPADAGIVAIDFRASPPQLVDAQGNAMALSEARLTGETRGIRAQNAEGGLLVAREGGETVLMAARTEDYGGDEARTHRGENLEEVLIGAGDRRLRSEVAQASTPKTTAQVRLEAGDNRIASAPAAQIAALAPAANAPRMSFVPLADGAGQVSSREIVEAMIQSAQSSLFGVGGAGLGALAAVGLGAVQSAAYATETPTLGSAGVSSPMESVPEISSSSNVFTALPASAPAGQFAPLPGGGEALAGVSFQSVGLGAFQAPKASATSAPAPNVGPAAAASAPEATAVQENAAPVNLAAVVISAGKAAPSGMTTAASNKADSPADIPPDPAPAPLSGTVLQYPVVLGEALDGTEDVALRLPVSLLLANDSTINAVADPSRPALSIIAVFGAVHGQASLQTRFDEASRQTVTEVIFLPEENFHGTASFEYTVTDQYGLTQSATATLEIAAVNDLPVTAGENANMDEDTGLIFTQAQLLANDSDVDTATDGQALSVSRVGAAQHGAVWLDAAGQVRFAPDANYHGPAQFTYWVADSAGGEAPATMSVLVAAVNDLPVALGEQTTTDEDTTLYIDPATLLANDSDVDIVTDGQVLSISAVGNATHGAVTLLPSGSIRFAPETNFHGVATFDYTVNDAVGGTAVATAVVNLAAVNDAPLAVGEQATGTEDTELLFGKVGLLANDSDADMVTDADVLDIRRVGLAQHGSVSLDNQGRIHFIPDANYHGPAQFTYWVSDIAGAETAATVSLNIAAMNDLPVANGEVVSGDEDVILVFDPATLLANDSDVDAATDGQSLSVSAVSNARHGSVRLLADGAVEFAPEADYAGTASFSYTVSDGQGGSSNAVATVSLAAVNDAPTVNGESVAGKGNVPITFTQAALLANDSDVDNIHAALSITGVNNASHGVAALQGDGSIRFTPDAGYYGAAGFDYTVSDGAGGATPGHVSLDLSHVNIAPTAVDDGFTGDEDISFVIAQSQLLANDSDADNAHADLRVSAVGGAQNGVAALQGDGSIRFTPTANYNGAASFTYTVSDGDGGQAQARAALTVNPVNDAPVITSAKFSDGRIYANDPDGDSSKLAYSLETKPVHGSVEINGYWESYIDPMDALRNRWVDDAPGYSGYFSYGSTNGDAYSGADPFEVKVTDAGGASTKVRVEATHTGTSSGGGGGGGCPIVVDLDGDGVELVAPDESYVFADVNDDGWRDRIGWAGSDDGLLALDRNGDGHISLLDEVSFSSDLPGIHTDLEGLRAHDSNGDDFISASDAEWPKFGIWRDANSNGVQETGEFRTLDDMGVARIGLTSDGQARVGHGNVVFGETRVELATGESLVAADVMLAGQGVPYPSVVQEGLAGLAQPPLFDEAELARRAHAFVQACVTAHLDTAAPLSFIDTNELHRDAPMLPDSEMPIEQVVRI